ncbi:hypothetical protein M0804_001691 [Polistes exclamans]|nr:hypothetical protein M0804_001691 [Polistes exclamans]
MFHANISTVAHWAAHGALCPQTNPETTIDSGKHVAPSRTAPCKTSNDELFLLPVGHRGVVLPKKFTGLYPFKSLFVILPSCYPSLPNHSTCRTPFDSGKGMTLLYLHYR